MKIIYGAGNFGKKLYNFLQEQGVMIDYFCQTKVSMKSIVFGKELISVEQLKKKTGFKEIYIAIDNDEVSKDIKRKLYNIFWDEIRVYECGGFIRLNLQEKGNKFCCLCGSQVEMFLSGGIKEHIFEKHHIIGGGHREGMVCPVCKGVDRERWLMYVLSKNTDIFTERRKRVLHFAPEDHVGDFLRSDSNGDYYAADIAGGDRHKIDVTDILFADNTFDYVIINHVLEHVLDDKKALSELKRVLKKDGQLILSFPICTDQDTYEDSRITSPADRLKVFGQEDHVRLYGRDYRERIEMAGFKVRVYSPNMECQPDEIKRFGFIEDDVIMICEK